MLRFLSSHGYYAWLAGTGFAGFIAGITAFSRGRLFRTSLGAAVQVISALTVFALPVALFFKYTLVSAIFALLIGFIFGIIGQVFQIRVRHRLFRQYRAKQHDI